MGTITTVGKLLLKNSVPQGFHNFVTSTELDKKGTATLFNRMADEAPHDYKDAVSKLTRLGFEISTRLGSTVGLADLVSPIDQKEAFAKLDKELDELRIKFKDKKQYDIEANRAYQKFADDINRQLIEVGVKKNQTLAKVIRSGSRGSAAQYRQTVFSPVVVQDAKGNVMVDFPVRKSFADGLSLPEYLSATFGARAGEVSKKLAVADAGAFSKELSRGSMTIKVEENDCGTQNGIDVPTDDKDSIGAFLAHGVGGFNRNNEVTGRMLNELKAKAITHLVIRSPITCQSSKKFHSGAVCQLCAGKGAKGLPQLGEHVGITAASGLGESLAQGTLNVKHCLFEDTLVRMGDGTVKKIKDIQIGEQVMGANRKGEIAPTEVLDVVYQGIQPTFTYEFRYGASSRKFEITSTDDHVCLANVKVSGQVGEENNHVIQERRIGEKRKYWSLVLPIERTDSEGKSVPEALLLGLLIGDGCFTEKVGRVNFSCFDDSLIHDVTEYVDSLGFEIRRNANKGYYRIVNKNTPKALVNSKGQFTAVNNPVKELLVRHGVYGKYSYQKQLPEDVLSWNKSSICALLSGLIATDGCLFEQGKTKGISFSSTSKKLVEQVAELFFTHCCVYATKIQESNHGFNSARTLYTVRFTDQFCVTKACSQLSIPGVKGVIQRRWVAEAEHQKEFYTAGRQSISQAGLLPCYDLMVGNEHNLFVLANGAIVHNTSGSATGPNLSGGFALIDQLASVPKTFKNKAAVASLDGSVKEIRPAPQGGTYIHVSDGKKTEEYYVPSGFGLKVKAGDQVEAGDILSEGIVNPAEIVKFKGIGEGRKYWTTSMKKVFDDSGMGGINRRNFEMLSKNMVDHVVITSNDGVGDHLPGEIVSYQAIEREYQPRPGATHTRVDQAYNQYLEEPVLHYTLGTRITKQIIKNLQSRGIENVLVHKSSPGFEPEMQRIDALPMFEPDWMHQLYSTNLERRLLNAVNRGMSSNIRGASPIPGLAYASGFGQKKAEEDTDE